MADMKKTLDQLKNGFDEAVTKATASLQDNTKDLSSTIAKERKKMELRSQIGKHQRNIQKAYTRLGEIYYNHETAGQSLTDATDVMDILKANNKVIELLNDQLNRLEAEDDK